MTGVSFGRHDGQGRTVERAGGHDGRDAAGAGGGRGRRGYFSRAPRLAA